MATGDVSDIFGRLKRYLPKRWFGSPTDSTPILDAILTGIATVLAEIYALYAYAKLQTRIATATGGFLDLIAYDYFGNGLPRLTGESDNAYRARILANLIRGAATRSAINAAVQGVTGNPATIVEPWRPEDCGAYSVPTTGYGAAGYYGSVSCPAQAFITATLPISNPNDATLASIGEAVSTVKAEGTKMWIRISD